MQCPWRNPQVAKFVNTTILFYFHKALGKIRARIRHSRATATRRCGRLSNWRGRHQSPAKVPKSIWTSSLSKPWLSLPEGL